MPEFKVISKYQPTGDQPQAIETLANGIAEGARSQVLLGVTGSGKTFTMSKVIERTQKPALIISPNKTLAAQLYQEFKEFFPDSGVHYFVSYYDYYQPEAYIPQTDTYIEKDAKINETIDRLRHEAVQDILFRRDAIVIASVSCIYNIGSPEEYQNVSFAIQKGQRMSRKELLSYLTSLQYARNDTDFRPGTFRVRGETVEIFLVTGKETVRVEFFGDQIEYIAASSDPIKAQYENLSDSYRLYPAKFWVADQDKLKIAIGNIKTELAERLRELQAQGKTLEAQRLEQRTLYDLEMIEESGYCHGIENYSRHMEFRNSGDAPYTMLDYFAASAKQTTGNANDFLVIVDESHLTISQIRAMAIQDRMRKQALIEHGFRLPSAIDNRPLTFDEFLAKSPQFIYVSATPGEWEAEQALAGGQALAGQALAPGPWPGGRAGGQAGRDRIVEQIIRPTGLLEPEIEVRSTKNQITDLISEIEKRKERNQRSLVITLTKRLAEETASYLEEHGIKTKWLHSEIKTLERPAIIEQFREGAFDVIVGINLLREGLDLPEVALVAILDADKEGFLRNETTLIQTMGRAARHPEGRAILYADTITGSMRSAIKEIERRRNIQRAYNKKHGITPEAIIKEIRKWPFPANKKEAIASELQMFAEQDIKTLEREMKEAADQLDFERAAAIRDLIKKKKDGTV